MAAQSKVVKIDDVEYELTQIGGVEGLDLWDRLCEKLGGRMAAAVKTGLIASGNVDAVEASVAIDLVEALTTLPADLKSELRIRFAALSKIKAASLLLPLGGGKQLQPGDTFDQHFAGRFGHMSKWMLECLRWSFGDFLSSSKKSGAQPAAPTA